MGTIEIRRLKHIDLLQFQIPGPGVWLLCGANGSGKTSLLACLLRIGMPNAFSTFFRASTVSAQLDQVEDAEVSYTAAGRSVTYAYGGQRWVPRPRANTTVLDEFGYASVEYIGANASRIEPRPEDFRPQRVRDVPEELAAAAADILGERFRNLKRINVRRGTGAEAFLLLDDARIAANRGQRNYYYSERTFSLGELCVLKLLRQLLDCAENSLVLVDELELALHPNAQIALLRFLDDLARRKRLTVIFSTHSVSLIRSARQSQILLLQRSADGVICLPNAYPAQAIGALGASADAAPDVAIFVEDDMARYMVDAALAIVIARHLGTNILPSVVVQPVGGFTNVINFLERAPALLAATTRPFALLDDDVRAESIAQAEANGNHEFLARVNHVRDRMSYLPWTPEVGIAQRFSTDREGSLQSLRRLFQDPRITLPIGVDWTAISRLEGGRLRREAKAAVHTLVEGIGLIKGLGEVEVRRGLCQWFIHTAFEDEVTRNQLAALLMPLLR